MQKSDFLKDVVRHVDVTAFDEIDETRRAISTHTDRDHKLTLDVRVFKRVPSGEGRRLHFLHEDIGPLI